MNPLEIILKETNKNGVQVEVTRQRSDGVLEPAKPQELASLNTKSRVASTAQLLQRLTKEEKLEWAIETKDEGNTLFQEQQYKEAMEKYVEALSATDFGSKEGIESGNVDVLVIPILCNLAACCIQLEQWAKAILFCDQALTLRPFCQKAQYRKAIGLLHVGEYSESIALLKEITNDLTAAQSQQIEEVTDPSEVKDTSKSLSEKEIKRIPHLMSLAMEKRRKEREVFAKQKESLQKAFQSEQKIPVQQVVPESEKKVKLMSFFELFCFFFEYIYHVFLLPLFGQPVTSSGSKDKQD